MRIIHFLKCAIFSCFVFSISACVVPAESITLQTQVNVPKNQIGRGRPVFISIVDDRPSEYLGSRVGARGAGGKISLSENNLADIRSQVEKGLLQNGFKPTDIPNEKIQRKMAVHLVGLQYNWRPGDFYGVVTITSIVSVTAENDGEEFQNIYRAVNNYKIVFTPTLREDTAHINATLSDSLDKLLNDSRLIKFLASRP